MNRYLFDTSSARQRNRRLALTITGSLLFHGALVGGAAFFRHPVAPPEDPIITVPFETPAPPEGAALPEPSVSTPEPENLPTPVLAPVEVPIDTPPLAPDPEMALDPTPSTPPPVARQPVTPTRFHGLPVTSVKPGTAGPATGSRGAGPGGPAAGGVRWNVSSKPAYPQALKAARVQGSGVIKITTDASGRVVGAVVVQSTGNAALDANTCQHARSFWSGPANTSTEVPVTYRLQ